MRSFAQLPRHCLSLCVIPVMAIGATGMACRPAGPGCGPVFPPDGRRGLVADSRDGRSGLPRATGLSRSAGRPARRGRRRLPARPGPAVRCAAHPVGRPRRGRWPASCKDRQKRERSRRGPASAAGARAASFWASRAGCSARARAWSGAPCLGCPTARTVIEATAWLAGLHLLTLSSGEYTAKSPAVPEL